MKMLQRRRSPLEERVFMNPHVEMLDDWSVIVLYYTHQNHNYSSNSTTCMSILPARGRYKHTVSTVWIAAVVELRSAPSRQRAEKSVAEHRVSEEAVTRQAVRAHEEEQESCAQRVSERKNHE
jgi:hypothetical protein